jgi:sec-independent protein translocase protein TatA
MLGLDNPIHIVFVLIVLLLVFGAKRLPEMGKSMGEGLRGFKDSLSGEGHLTQMTGDHAAHVQELTSAPAVAVAVPVVVPTTSERGVEQVPVVREQTPMTPVA